MPYCGICGAQINLDVKFCGNCGAMQNFNTGTAPMQVQPKAAQPVSFTPPPPPPPPPPQASVTQAPAVNYFQAQPVAQRTYSEQIIGAIVLRRPKSLGRYDTFTGVLTNQRFIIAQMTSDMVKDATMQARDQAKADGKGFWGQWSEQLKASFGYTRRYLTMQPDAIIAETPGNFAVNNDTIREIKLKLKNIGQPDDNRHEFEVEIQSSIGKYEYRMDEHSDFVDLLKKAYPDRVKMPFGYFSKTIHIGPKF
jgi:hypothetical protein